MNRSSQRTLRQERKFFTRSCIPVGGVFAAYSLRDLLFNSPRVRMGNPFRSEMRPGRVVDLHDGGLQMNRRTAEQGIPNVEMTARISAFYIP